MLNLPDFKKKQILFVFFNQGDTLSFQNDNVVVRDKERKIKIQCSCYRVFLIYAIGNFSITSPLVQNARKFGFFVVLMSTTFRIHEILGSAKEGNTLLKQRQYSYESIEIAKKIIINKIFMQRETLKKRRNKEENLKNAIDLLTQHIKKIESAEKIQEIMGLEGISAKLYFKNHFDNVNWSGRTPRLKRDYVNSTLDIGYTLLFNFIDSILLTYGFDTYKGVLHKQFYMRKSLVCDIVEPFRTLIDEQVKKSINLGQIKEEDFKNINNQMQLEWKKSPYYTNILMTPILMQKNEIFVYVQKYYRCFMKGTSIEEYPFYSGGKEYDCNKL